MFEELSSVEADPVDAEPANAELSAWLADVPEPDWLEHPVYSGLLTGADRLLELADREPAGRSSTDLASLDPRELSPMQRVDLLSLLAEQQNWLDAVKARVLAVIDEGDSTEQRLSQETVSLALMVPGRAAQNQLKTAATLTSELPRTLELLRQGQISGRHADVIAEASWQLPTGLLPDLEAQVLDRAPEQTVPQFKQSVRRALIALDPATAEQRHQRALADRRVGFRPADDGMVELPVLLPAPQGQLIFTRLTAAARLLPAADPRTMDQKRADLLVDAVLSGLPSDTLPKSHGQRPSIQVMVAADTLLCLDDQPGQLTGYGPITAETARRLAADESATWRRLLTDPDTGALLDISPDRYRPGRRLRNFIAARDEVCAFPTCNQPGYRCDYDHIKPFSQGGRTCRCNGALACRRHNNCKINTGWRYRRNPDGTFTWTTDTGHEYISHRPDWTRPAGSENREQSPPDAANHEQEP